MASPCVPIGGIVACELCPCKRLKILLRPVLIDFLLGFRDIVSAGPCTLAMNYLAMISIMSSNSIRSIVFAAINKSMAFLKSSLLVAARSASINGHLQASNRGRWTHDKQATHLMDKAIGGIDSKASADMSALFL